MAPKTIQAVKGTFDVFPEDAPFWRHIEETARETFEIYGYEEIRTPIFEVTELFVRSIGEVTDIVQKEMYTFTDPGGRSLTLRPEATAPVVRAFLEQRVHVNRPFVKYYYVGPMFRSERPQAGRSRQFHQVGVEAIGSQAASVDAEVIALAAGYFSRLGLDDVCLRLNSVGCSACKEAYSGELREFLVPRKEELCEDCRARVDRNVFRVMDCKNTACRDVIEQAPAILDRLCAPCRTHFDEVCSLLGLIGVSCTVESRLVRGLDYYTRTVFEITHAALGAKDAIGAGGRYDNLVEEMGGPSLGAVGFAVGVERTIMAFRQKGIGIPPASGKLVYLVSLGEDAFRRNYQLMEELRRDGIRARMDPEPRSAKAQMRAADRFGAALCVIRGENEIEKGVVCLRDMAFGEEDQVLEKDLRDRLLKKIQEENR